MSMEVENPLPQEADAEDPPPPQEEEAFDDDDDAAMPTTRAELQPLISKGMQDALDQPAAQSKVESVAMTVFGKLTEAAPNWYVQSNALTPRSVRPSLTDLLAHRPSASCVSWPCLW